MFTKLNRVLLASGLAVASAALLSPAVFAQTIIDGKSASADLVGTLPATVTLTWTGATLAFDIPTNGLPSHPLGTITASGNASYRVTGSSANSGTLKAVDNSTIVYTLNLGGSPTPQPPSTANFLVYQGTANEPLNGGEAGALTLSIASGAITNQLPQNYLDTLTLTTVSP